MAGGDRGARARADQGVTEAYEGITVDVFERAARRFFEIARHPVLGVPYTRLAYHRCAS
jgi:hypothetical protein